MPMKNPERAISYLTGEVHALFMFAQVVARTHPDPSALLAELHEAGQQGLAMLEPLAVQDAAIEGYQFAIDALRKRAEEAAAGSPHI
ncbi:MAG TPA: hypothetical protein VGU20_00715 [Stellaceae bacterium]|nr:hypothetical protein [Stellaceae bacterium]